MSTPKSIEESLLDWRQMLDNLAPHLDEMPQLRPLHEAFEALLAEAGALQNERYLHASRLREVNRKRRDAHAAGRELRNRVVASLQGALGSKSEQLIEFGVKPRPRDARRHRPTADERAERARQAAAAAAAKAEESAAPKRAGRSKDPSLVN
jgi:hypothetical protein